MTRVDTSILAVVLVTWFSGTNVKGQINGSPSPDYEFLTTPENSTVPEGEPAVFKCLVATPSHVCRWYFLELGLDFFSQHVTPMLIREFKPSHRRDCSIRIKQVRKAQEGQWLCQVLKFQSSKFLMTKPAVLRVITESESRTWTPPPEPTPPRQGRRDPETRINKVDTTPGKVEFKLSAEDYIQNAELGDSVMLKCQVNQPITSCSWVMPHGAFLNMSLGKVESSTLATHSDDYRLEGDLNEGNCTLHVHEVQLQDEGDWRCVVKAGKQESQGPLMHLHINKQDSYNHEGTPLLDPEVKSSNTLVILLVIVCTILLVTVILLFIRLYRRVQNSEERHKILSGSPRGSLDMACKTIPSTDLTSSSVLAVEVRKKVPACLPLDRYNPYLDMSGKSCSGDGYIMMPGTSIRSSTSSRTTLSTLSTGSRSRTASSSTTLSNEFPHIMNLVDNPSYRVSPEHPRPDSIYKSDHIYEEIKEKVPEIMEKIPEVTTPVTPTYTNLQKDYEGYMIPKTVSNENIKSQGGPELPPPNPGQNPDASNRETVSSPNHSPHSPYSHINECGLVPVILPDQLSLGPGYSRVGTLNTFEGYDTPRPHPPNIALSPTTIPHPPNIALSPTTIPPNTAFSPTPTGPNPPNTALSPVIPLPNTSLSPTEAPVNPIDSYDVPRKVPTQLSLPPNIPEPPSVSVDVLPGTIV